MEHLQKEKYIEAEEAFSNSNFDPTEMLTNFFRTYTWDYTGNSTTAESKEKLKFLVAVLRKKRTQIIENHPNPDTDTIDSSMLQTNRIVKASVWLEHIDFAIIKCYLDLEKYKDLIDFFSHSEKIFCSNIKERMKG